MFGIFKKLLGKEEPPPSKAAPASKPASQPRSAPVAQPAPARAPAAAAAPAIAAGNGETIAVPLKAVLKKLPGELLAKVDRNPMAGEEAAIPTSLVADQLKMGSVKISFAELRRASPSGIFALTSVGDQGLVELPLSEILNRIPPQLLERRKDQRRIEISDSIPNLFGPKGEALSVRIGAEKVAEPVRGRPQPAPEETPAREEAAPAPVTPKPAAGTVPRAPETPAPSVEAPAESIKMSSQLRDALSAAVTSASSKPPAPAAAAPAPAAPKKPASGPPAEISVLSVQKDWPLPILEEIAKGQLSSGTLKIPLSELEEALKSGHAVFAWSELLGWLSTSSGSPAPASAQGHISLTLPLKVVVPLFLKLYQPRTGRKKLEPSASIPDCFRGREEAAAAAPVAEVRPATPAAAPAAKPQSATARVLDQLMAQNGVAGAVVATLDGFQIENRLPADLPAEKVAAMLSQVLSRADSAMKELQRGGVTDLLLVSGGLPWVVIRRDPVCVVVAGKSGASLSIDALRPLTAELSAPQK